MRPAFERGDKVEVKRYQERAGDPEVWMAGEVMYIDRCEVAVRLNTGGVHMARRRNDQIRRAGA